ncbi:MAG TPA: hypothetical protein VN703_01615 [Candidatus Sulfopaludibacter sp.]|nr:hypothetical protein [Candidatus Sulfopaludibacter sp.]
MHTRRGTTKLLFAKSSTPTQSSLPKTIVPPSHENILDIVIPCSS